MTDTIHHFINGKITQGSSDKTGDVFNPATGEIIKRVAFANQQDINQAVAAAKAAFPEWSNTPAVKRARIMFKYKELLEKNMDELALLISNEHGKLINDAKGSIIRGLEVVEFVCGAPYLLKGWFSENIGPDIDTYTIRQSLGVCVGITPFNFPAMIPLWMFPMALVCGNTFVLKPSEKDPSCPLRLVELMQQAGLPDGVLNVVNGDKVAVDALLTHPDVAAISFVGSTPVAEYIYKTGTAHAKRVQAFGGAKNHCIVMPDADLDQAADAIAGAAYGSAGERCMALSVAVTVGDDVGDELIQKLISRTKQLKIGSAQDNNTDMGPLITQQHREKVINYVNEGIKEGAELMVDGREFKLTGHEKGFFMGGCLFDKVTPKMKIYREEIFGPVLIVVRAKNFDEALALINENEYGNGTAIFTRDGDTARTFASKVNVGMVGINVPIPVPVPYHAFGGWKRSIFAGTHMHGTEGISFNTRLKTVTTRWPTGIRSGADFMMPVHK